MTRFSFFILFSILLSACSSSNLDDINGEIPKVEDTKWIMDGTNGKAYMTFNSASKNIQASAGCNGMGGAYELKGETLKTDRFASTLMYCEGRMEDERKLGDAITTANRVLVSGNKLTLLKDQKILATFTVE